MLAAIGNARASSLKLEPFCRGGFGSKSSGPSQCVAVLRTRRDAQRSGQIRPAQPKRSLAPPRRVCKRRPPSSSKRLPVAPATGCTLLLLARLAVCKQNCFQLKARRSRWFVAKSWLDLNAPYGSKLPVRLSCQLRSVQPRKRPAIQNSCAAQQFDLGSRCARVPQKARSN